MMNENENRKQHPSSNDGAVLPFSPTTVKIIWSAPKIIGNAEEKERPQGQMASSVADKNNNNKHDTGNTPLSSSSSPDNHKLLLKLHDDETETILNECEAYINDEINAEAKIQASSIPPPPPTTTNNQNEDVTPNPKNNDSNINDEGDKKQESSSSASDSEFAKGISGGTSNSRDGSSRSIDDKKPSASSGVHIARGSTSNLHSYEAAQHAGIQAQAFQTQMAHAQAQSSTVQAQALLVQQAQELKQQREMMKAMMDEAAKAQEQAKLQLEIAKEEAKTELLRAQTQAAQILYQAQQQKEQQQQQQQQQKQQSSKAATQGILRKKAPPQDSSINLMDKKLPSNCNDNKKKAGTKSSITARAKKFDEDALTPSQYWWWKYADEAKFLYDECLSFTKKHKDKYPRWTIDITTRAVFAYIQFMVCKVAFRDYKNEPPILIPPPLVYRVWNIHLNEHTVHYIATCMKFVNYHDKETAKTIVDNGENSLPTTSNANTNDESNNDNIPNYVVHLNMKYHCNYETTDLQTQTQQRQSFRSKLFNNVKYTRECIFDMFGNKDVDKELWDYSSTINNLGFVIPVVPPPPSTADAVAAATIRANKASEAARKRSEKAAEAARKRAEKAAEVAKKEAEKAAETAKKEKAAQAERKKANKAAEASRKKGDKDSESLRKKADKIAEAARKKAEQDAALARMIAERAARAAKRGATRIMTGTAAAAAKADDNMPRFSAASSVGAGYVDAVGNTTNSFHNNDSSNFYNNAFVANAGLNGVTGSRIFNPLDPFSNFQGTVPDFQGNIPETMATAASTTPATTAAYAAAASTSTLAGDSFNHANAAQLYNTLFPSTSTATIGGGMQQNSNVAEEENKKTSSFNQFGEQLAQTRSYPHPPPAAESDSDNSDNTSSSRSSDSNGEGKSHHSRPPYPPPPYPPGHHRPPYGYPPPPHSSDDDSSISTNDRRRRYHRKRSRYSSSSSSSSSDESKERRKHRKKKKKKKKTGRSSSLPINVDDIPDVPSSSNVIDVDAPDNNNNTAAGKSLPAVANNENKNDDKESILPSAVISSNVTK